MKLNVETLNIHHPLCPGAFPSSHATTPSQLLTRYSEYPSLHRLPSLNIPQQNGTLLSASELP